MTIEVEVVLALADRQLLVRLRLPAGSTVRGAIAAAGFEASAPGVDVGAMAVGVWSKSCDREQPLRQGDRVELYRPLMADPKAARRTRARLKTSSTRARSGR